MKCPLVAGLAGRLIAVSATAAALLSGCQVGPPKEREVAQEGVVRASDRLLAIEVGRELDELLPLVLEILPDTQRRPLEVWIQEVPALYAFKTSAYSDADGFYAEGAQRIHLREGSDNLRRTLVHELVHATLGPSWRTLPGTLEEGLCDVVSARLCPDSAPRLAAGRLSSAAFATGGLVLDVDLETRTGRRGGGNGGELGALNHGADGGENGGENQVCWSARLRLDGEPRLRIDPLRAFDVRAGLSTSDLAPEEKKACYGIAFLVVLRIVERNGFEGLHDLCTQAEAEGLASVPAGRLLAAAGLVASTLSFRTAIDEAFGPAELHELVRAHPEFLVSTLTRYLGPMSAVTGAVEGLDDMSARVSVAGSTRSGIAVPTLAQWRGRVEAALALSHLEFAAH
jgi:hypothetical protein